VLVIVWGMEVCGEFKFQCDVGGVWGPECENDWEQGDIVGYLWQSVDDKVWYSEWMFGWQCITGPDGVIWRVVRLIILVGLGRGLVVQMHINCHQVEVNICGWQVAAWAVG